MSGDPELTHLVQTGLTAQGHPISDLQANSLIDALATITPGSVSAEPSHHAEWIVLDGRGGVEGGVTIKPGNMRLSLRKLVTAIAGGVLTAVAMTSPILAFCGALVLWDSVYSLVKADISPQCAGVLWTMWLHRQTSDNTIAKSGLIALVNEQMQRYHGKSLTEKELDASLNLLQMMKCIQISNSDPSRWWLREWVQVKC